MEVQESKYDFFSLLYLHFVLHECIKGWVTIGKIYSGLIFFKPYNIVYYMKGNLSI